MDGRSSLLFWSVIHEIPLFGFRKDNGAVKNIRACASEIRKELVQGMWRILSLSGFSRHSLNLKCQEFDTKLARYLLLKRKTAQYGN